MYIHYTVCMYVCKCCAVYQLPLLVLYSVYIVGYRTALTFTPRNFSVLLVLPYRPAYRIPIVTGTWKSCFTGEIQRL